MSTKAAIVEICFDCQEKKALTSGLCHTCYERMRRRAVANGTWESIFVPIDKTLERINDLISIGYGVPLISCLSNVSERTINRARNGSYRLISSITEERILAVQPISLWELWKTTEWVHRMPSGPVVRRLRALATDGWSYPMLGELLGWNNTQVSRYVNRPTKYVLSSTTRHVDALYQSNIVAIPVREPRIDIIKKCWPLPFEWDNIDDPTEEPKAVRRARNRVKAILGELDEAVRL